MCPFRETDGPPLFFLFFLLYSCHCRENRSHKQRSNIFLKFFSFKNNNRSYCSQPLSFEFGGRKRRAFQIKTAKKKPEKTKHLKSLITTSAVFLLFLFLTVIFLNALQANQPVSAHTHSGRHTDKNLRCVRGGALLK